MEQEIARFLGHLAEERGLAENTVAAYRNDLSQFVQFLRSRNTAAQEVVAVEQGVDGNGRTADTSHREAVVEFMLYLKDQGYAPATVARKLAALKSFFHYMQKCGMIATDPTEHLGIPEVRRPVPKAIAPEEVARLFEKARGGDSPEELRNQAMLFLLYSTGMRVTELVSLDIGDVDLERGQVRCVGRRGRTRTIPIESTALSVLREYLRSGRPAYVRDHQQTALFVNHRGQRLTRQGFWLIMKEMARSVGMGGISPHTLRHTFAAHKLSRGLALRKLQELLGHANISTTQIYAQLVANRQSDGRGRVDYGANQQAN